MTHIDAIVEDEEVATARAQLETALATAPERARARRQVVIENGSTRYTDDIERVLPLITAAIDAQLHQMAADHGVYVWHAVEGANRSGWHVKVLDNTDQADALAWHSVDDQGRPFAVAFVQTILEDGGSLLDGALSLAAAISHEVVEMIGNPVCGAWNDDFNGREWAQENSDPVQADAYPLSVSTTGPDGQATEVDVWVSNYIFPAWWNPFATDGPFDHMRLCTRPFEIRPGGYAIVRDVTTGEKAIDGNPSRPPGRRTRFLLDAS